MRFAVKKLPSILILPMLLFSISVRTNTQWVGSLYSENSVPQKMWFDSFSSGLPINGNEQVLDIGCGDGKLTLEIAKRLKNGSIHGIDVSKSMIDFAQKMHQQNNLRFSVGDARSFTLNKKFDLIISFTALHWVKEYKQVIQRAREHLKPNGRIYFVFSAKWQHLPLNKALHALYKSKTWAPYFKDYDPGYYLHSIDEQFDILNRYGFEVKEITLRNKLTIFKTKSDFFSWLKAWLPQQNQVPKGQGDTFIHDFISEYSKLGTVNTQGVHWEGYSLKVEASIKTSVPQNQTDSFSLHTIH